jgi:pimeloyl-ACP methyl ester carboxylesterase
MLSSRRAQADCTPRRINSARHRQVTSVALFSEQRRGLGTCNDLRLSQTFRKPAMSMIRSTKDVFSQGSWLGRLCCLGLLFAAQGFALSGAQENPAPVTTVCVNGIEMYYESHGKGEPLVLLHGFNASGQVWQNFIPELSRHFNVIVPDLRGHGRSNNPTRKFTHRESAQDILALLDSLGFKRVRAMGISTGGMTLIHMATQQPDRLESMVLIGATIYFPEQARVIMRRTTVESLTPADYDRLRRVHSRGDEQIRELRQQFHDFSDSYDDMNFTGLLLSTITARTLVVHGDRDEFFPVDIPVEMYRSIPRSYLWIVPNGGHVPIFKPSVPFMATALEFLGAGKARKLSDAQPQ